MKWIESGGPPVTTPVRQGLGMRLINRTMGTADGGVSLDFAPIGVRWRVGVPLTGLPSGEVGHGIPPGTSAAARATPAAVDHRRVLLVEDDPLLGLDLRTTLVDADMDVVGPLAVRSPRP